ncbi:hypothetical protein KEH51_29795 [[Brevibacterium] frigoritolerans]|uniref:Uncharacterized protein n=1 Tax=Peribacillus frigoritolerans TaxID=450367 RepID=A0A941JC63_9BACI|nr:hypothetical protein [Peribacillus frigoritolerans]
MKREVRDSCGKSASKETHRRKAPRRLLTARGKRVPGVEINVRIYKLKT